MREAWELEFKQCSNSQNQSPPAGLVMVPGLSQIYKGHSDKPNQREQNQRLVAVTRHHHSQVSTEYQALTLLKELVFQGK